MTGCSRRTDGSVPQGPMTNREIENAAIALVLRREHAAGRTAVDVRHRNALADIEGDRIIEVKAYGGSARGQDLWLETRQVEAALHDPERFHLVIVEHIRTGAPRIIDIQGARLSTLLSRRREKRYFEVPFPTRTYDDLIAENRDDT